MKPNGASRRRVRLHVLCAVMGVGVLVATNISAVGAQPVGLGTAENFAVLAGSTITNTGPTRIIGDVGLHPGTATPGFTSVTLTGTLHVANAAAAQAKADLVTAYNDAAGRGPVTTIATELGGQVLKPGVYASASGTFQITGTLTLDAENNPDAVFVFKTGSTLITAPDSRVVLINGAQPCNVFWQVGSSATLGLRTTFVGTILALTTITAETGATVQGRLLARNGAVTLDTNTITRPVCAPTTTTTVPATTTTAVPGTTTTAPPVTTTTAPPTTTTTAPPGTTTTALPGTTTPAPQGTTTTTAAPSTTTTPPATGTTSPPAASPATTAGPGSTTTTTVGPPSVVAQATPGQVRLARTGTDVDRLVLQGAMAIALGVAAVATTSRRRRSVLAYRRALDRAAAADLVEFGCYISRPPPPLPGRRPPPG